MTQRLKAKTTQLVVGQTDLTQQSSTSQSTGEHPTVAHAVGAQINLPNMGEGIRRGQESCCPCVAQLATP
jgi:hypothetical protein